MTAYSRNRGNRAEVEAVNALGRLGLQAITSRNARGGSQQGVDILVPDLPVSLEVKDQSRDALPGWLDQARVQGDEEAPGAVLHKRRGRGRAEEWFLTMQFDDFVRLCGRLRSVPLDDAEVPF